MGCPNIRGTSEEGEEGERSGVGYQDRDKGSCSMHIGTLWTGHRFNLACQSCK